MHHDEVSIFLNGSDSIQFVPAPHSRVRDDYDHWTNEDKHLGTFSHIEFRCSDFKIWLTYYEAANDCTLKVKTDSLSCLSLCYTLGENIHYAVKGLPDGISRKGYYNMVYLPQVEITYTLTKHKPIILLSIDFARDALIDSGIPPVLAPLLDSALAGKAELLSRGRGEYLILKSMTPVLDRLVNEMRSGEISTGYPFKYNILELAHSSFEAAGMYEGDVERKDIFQIKSFIDENLSTVSVPVLVDHFHITQPNMRLLFLKHTGLNTFNYIKEARMQKAKELILLGTDRMKNIYPVVGYKNGSSFAAAFFKRFKIWPKDARKHGFDTPDNVH